MKKIFILLSVLSFAACSSMEWKAETLARSYMEQVLYYPDSYEVVSTQIDSAYTSIYMDGAILEAARKLVELDKDDFSREQLRREYNSAKSSAAIWSDNYSAYSRERYRQAREEMEELSRKLQEIEDKYDEQKSIIRRRAREVEPGQYCGWLIYHRYRAKNGLDQMLVSDIALLADENMERVMQVFDLDENEETGIKNLRRVIDDALREEK